MKMNEIIIRSFISGFFDAEVIIHKVSRKGLDTDQVLGFVAWYFETMVLCQSNYYKKSKSEKVRI